MKISGIYRIVNLVNGKQYIGSSADVEKRWINHRSDLRLNRHHSLYLQRSWNKYGADSFLFELLWKCDIEELLYEEQLALNNIKCEHNVCSVAGNNIGMKHTAESKAKMSQAQKGNQNCLGRVYSEQMRANMSASQTKTALKATREDGLIIYFGSTKDARKSGFDSSAIYKSIKTGRRRYGFIWEKV